MNDIQPIDHPAPARRDRGFTLVELLIVIVILGILATVTVFAVRGITDKGNESACEADRSTILTALEAFYAQNNSVYPESLADLSPEFTASEPDATKWSYTHTADNAATTNVNEEAYALAGAGDCAGF